MLNEKKASRSQNADSLQQAVDYALNKEKTEQDLFCSSIGCTLETAFADMCRVKQMWHKEGGVQGFHLVQSFAAGEGSPELVHQIGMELAEQLLGGRVQAVVATHLNTGHLHKPHRLEFCFHDRREKVPQQRQDLCHPGAADFRRTVPEAPSLGH